MFRLRQLRCSFCGKKDAEVSKLVAGPRVYICDACVAIASRMMDDSSNDGGQRLEDKPTFWRKLLTRARRFLRVGGALHVGEV